MAHSSSPAEWESLDEEHNKPAIREAVLETADAPVSDTLTEYRRALWDGTLKASE